MELFTNLTLSLWRPRSRLYEFRALKQMEGGREAAQRRALVASCEGWEISRNIAVEYFQGQKRMKVVHISTNEKHGGAARAAYRLHDGLCRIGYDSQMLVGSKTSDSKEVTAVECPPDIASRLRLHVRRYRIARSLRPYDALESCELFSDDRSEYGDLVPEQIPPCDVVNLHWVSGFLDYKSFFSRIQTPLVWTLHDMNPFTGGCHYNLSCDRYLDQCGSCFQLRSRDKDDLSSTIWKRKKAALSGVDSSRLSIVAPSRWLADEARRATLFNRFRVEVIPYGLDVHNTFVPRDRSAVRDLLGIPQNAKVVLFLAANANNPRKGLSLLVRALGRSALSMPDLFLLTLGHGRPRLDFHVAALHLGSLDNEWFLPFVYAAADIFAICSVQDNLPNTVLEAMACGLPVVGVEVGGIPDMVRTGVNGLTVPVGDEEILASTINRLLKNRDLSYEMGRASRRIAVEEYSLQLQAQRYTELYASLQRDCARQASWSLSSASELGKCSPTSKSAKTT